MFLIQLYNTQTCLNYLDALNTSRFLYTSTSTIVSNAISVPSEDIDNKVIATGEEYPGFKIVLSGTPVGICTGLKLKYIYKKCFNIM